MARLSRFSPRWLSKGNSGQSPELATANMEPLLKEDSLYESETLPDPVKSGFEKERRFWILTTSLLAVAWLVTGVWASSSTGSRNYEQGFSTDLQPALPAIRMETRQFYGGIEVNSSGDFALRLHPGSERFVGKPTAELDAAWDRIVGSYIKLTDEEVETIDSEASPEMGGFMVVLDTSLPKRVDELD